MVISGYGDTYSSLFFISFIWSGMNYIKTQLEQEPVPSNQSELQEEEDYFDIMKDNVQETSKQLDVYLTSYHHGRSQISACRVQIVPIACLCSQ